MKKSLLIISIFLGFQSFSQNYSLSDFEPKEMYNSIRLNYLMVHQPVDKVGYGLDPKMGFVGFNYNIPINDWLYTGAGFHGAITGDQGGLFTLGVNLGINLPVYKNIFFDANLHFGGGGGYRSLVNGGGIMIPNIGFQYKKTTTLLGFNILM